MKAFYTVNYETEKHVPPYIIKKTIKTIVIAESAKEAKEIVSKRYGYEPERLTARKHRD